MTKHLLSIHAHFYAPSRSNPLTGVIGSEKSAAPFRNWNERAAEEIYRPNTKLGNFEHLSFDIGEPMLEWLESHILPVYKRIVQSVQTNRLAQSVGNALAVPFYQSPLPLLSECDRLTQLRWGAAVAEKRFGYRPAGVMLPFFKADKATLQSVVDAGFEFTLLRSSQVSGLPRRGGAGPYRIQLESGDSVKVFVINDELSSSIANEIIERGGAGYWARRKLGSYNRHAGPLTLLYIDGETLGQHNMGEPHFIYYLLNYEAPSVAFNPVTLASYYAQNPALIGDIELKSETYQPDKSLGLVSNLQALMQEANHLFEAAHGEAAWTLRDNAIEQPLRLQHDPMLASQMVLQRAWANLVTMDYYPQITQSHVLNDVAFAVAMIHQETGNDLSAAFSKSLSETDIAAFGKYQHSIKLETPKHQATAN